MRNISKKRFYSLLIFSLVLLFNPNINVIDILPDFIAWFILAKLFEKAADSAPYFEEARLGFIKLGWISLAKIPGLLLILFVRGKNPLDNDVFALVSLSFAVVEAVFTVKAASNVFKGLFHLGERTSANALIAPFSPPICKKRLITPQNLKEYTYFFFICKSILYFLPDMFLLTRISKETGQLLSISKHYPTVLILSHLLGFVIGAIWIGRVIGYVKAIRNEGVFDEALCSMANEDSLMKIDTKAKLRSISFALTLICISSFFTVDLVFDNLRGINLLPNFVYGVLLLIGASVLRKHCHAKKSLFIFGGAFSVLSLTAYIFLARFLTKYTYSDIATSKTAANSYLMVIIFGVLEFLSLALFLIFTADAFRSFIVTHTGVSPESDRYLKMEKEYHWILVKKSYVMTVLGIIAGLVKCINILLNQRVKMIHANESDVMMPIISSSPVPWFNLVITVTSIMYIGYTLYFISTIKEEVKMKYINI